jgi:hypothetical protein
VIWLAAVRSKFPPRVYVALRNDGFSNREIAELLGINEASVRRGLKTVSYEAPSRVRRLLTDLADEIETLAV